MAFRPVPLQNNSQAVGDTGFRADVVQIAGLNIPQSATLTTLTAESDTAAIVAQIEAIKSILQNAGVLA